MATTSRVWKSNLNQPVAGPGSGAVTVTDQYQNILFQLHDWLINNASGPGWTLRASSGDANGSGHVATVADNIIIPSDIIIGRDAPVEARSWALYRSPALWTVGGSNGFVEFLWEVDENPAAAFPTVVNMYVGTDGFTLPPTASTTVRPLAGNEVKMAETLFTPQGALAIVDSKAHMAANSFGDWWFGLSEDGTQVLKRFLMFGAADRSLSVAAGGPDNINHAWWYARTPTLSTTQLFGSNNNAEIPDPEGDFANANTTGNLRSFASDLSSFTGGVSDASSKPIHFSIDAITSILNTPPDRYAGQLVDIRGTPIGMPSGIVEDGDFDSVRYVSLSNALFVPVEADQLPILL